MASCMRPLVRAGSTRFVKRTKIELQAPTIAVMELASWPCGGAASIFMPPPNAAFKSSITPDNIADSAGG